MGLSGVLTVASVASVTDGSALDTTTPAVSKRIKTKQNTAQEDVHNEEVTAGRARAVVLMIPTHTWSCEKMRGRLGRYHMNHEQGRSVIEVRLARHAIGTLSQIQTDEALNGCDIVWRGVVHELQDTRNSHFIKCARCIPCNDERDSYSTLSCQMKLK